MTKHINCTDFALLKKNKRCFWCVTYLFYPGTEMIQGIGMYVSTGHITKKVFLGKRLRISLDKINTLCFQWSWPICMNDEVAREILAYDQFLKQKDYCDNYQWFLLPNNIVCHFSYISIYFLKHTWGTIWSINRNRKVLISSDIKRRDHLSDFNLNDFNVKFSKNSILGSFSPPSPPSGPMFLSNPIHSQNNKRSEESHCRKVKRMYFVNTFYVYAK